MAIAAASVWEVRTAGNDTNGGGFVAGASGTDYSQQDAKNTVGNNISTTDLVAVGTTTLTSATASFTSAIVGNIIYLQGGTGALAAGWYEVTTFTNSTTIIVDRAVAAGTGITLNIGGALASPGQASANVVTGNSVYVKSGTYTITSATGAISGGCYLTTARSHLIGYQSTRGDMGTPPLLQASGISTFVLVQATNADGSTWNINVDGASLTSSRGFQQRGFAYKCGAMNCTNNGFIRSTSCTFVRCFATGCSTAQAFGNGQYVACIAYDNTAGGFGLSDAQGSAIRCIADSNSGATSDGFSCTSDSMLVNCVSYNSGRDGFRTTGDCTSFLNCIAESNGGYGFLFSNTHSCSVIFSSTFNNTSGTISLGTGSGSMTFSNFTPSVSVFRDAANQDFRLNNVAGAGRALKAAGYPGAFAVGGTSFLDIGALQHQDIARAFVIGG